MAVCPVEVSVAVLGGAWKMTIVKHLLDGPLRYGELRRRVGEVTPRVLTRQLRELEQDGILTRHAYPEVPPRVDYSLTPPVKPSATSSPNSTAGELARTAYLATLRT